MDKVGGVATLLLMSLCFVEAEQNSSSVLSSVDAAVPDCTGE